MGLKPEERLKALEGRPYSFDLENRDAYTADKGWNIDRYEIELPAEEPGPPLQHGPFAVAFDVLREYKFPPSNLIQGIYDPNVDLNERVMVLKATFFFFTFWFGVRVTRVVDETNDEKAGRERVRGYYYATLEGHFEHGEIGFLIVKNQTTGAVLMRIFAFSKASHISNIFYRIGFKIFGRFLQKRFAHQSLKRVKSMVENRLKSEEPQGRLEAPSNR